MTAAGMLDLIEIAAQSSCGNGTLMIGEEMRCSLLRVSHYLESICERIPDQRVHLPGPGLRNTQGMPRLGWRAHKLLACQEESIRRHVVSTLRHRTRRPADSHSGVSRSANQPSAIYTVLDAIQHCFDFMCSRRSVEQCYWNLSSQCAVWCREPMRCLLPVAQNVDRLRQGARSSDHDVRLLRRQARRQRVHLGIARVPIHRVTERADQGPKRPHCRQANHFYFEPVQEGLNVSTASRFWPARSHLNIGAADHFNQLNGCFCWQPFASRASEVEVRFDGCAENPLPSKQIGNLRIHIRLSSQTDIQ